ncbi:DNA-3-methyladenine glycosylase 2 [Aquisphaera giovannonii]|uniref:DNA-3-methyladenine glycosylase II n=1 Tax=Aquisphaera giovannonii TaxID=406548 RepID=A0A5B9VZZ3_9BACT|nr:AlkA N-terminal domain-containing protein [Aquisphaera giovannonii]QEH33823.1 DNA-3-methyladenine glycosylase 2 [Aquisphaera giovannonii]
MDANAETFYRALAARDARYDGLFFVGVTTTGIYCRPVCPARTPRAERCRFFPGAPAAEAAGFRPCLRCRPELAPGLAPADATGRIARLAAERIEAGALNDDGSIPGLAGELGVSARQLRRAIRKEFGVTAVALAQTRRLLLAKQLLTETDLPLIRVATASGFSSLRRFNALFRSHYGMPPSRLRKGAARVAPDGDLRLLLGYRPPMAWGFLLEFLASHSTAGVELVQGDAYARTVSIGPHRGWFRVRPVAGRDAIAVEVPSSLAPALPRLLGAIRALLDLDARPSAIAEHLGADPRLARGLAAAPGMRIPGSIDGFELAVRTILGQLISVKAATTLAGRLAAAFGDPIETPFPSLTRLSPGPERLVHAGEASLVGIGVAPTRARAVVSLAASVIAGRIRLDPGRDPEAAIDQLRGLPGVGDWTAQSIALRAFRWPDAFPASDLALVRAAGLRTTRELERTSQAWRPWRGYAAMALWHSYLHPSPET